MSPPPKKNQSVTKKCKNIILDGPTVPHIAQCWHVGGSDICVSVCTVKCCAVKRFITVVNDFKCQRSFNKYQTPVGSFSAERWSPASQVMWSKSHAPPHPSPYSSINTMQMSVKVTWTSGRQFHSGALKAAERSCLPGLCQQLRQPDSTGHCALITLHPRQETGFVFPPTHSHWSIQTSGSSPAKLAPSHSVQHTH